MHNGVELILRAAFIGVGATIVIDAWAWVLKRGLGMASLDMGMVGRWLGHLARGKFAHAGIARAAPVRGEQALGWVAHYVIGVVFALALLAFMGLDWARAPSVLPALLFGLLTVLFPFLLMQPAMGAGFAASKTPRPVQARLRSLLTHAVFGVGLYLAACLSAQWSVA